MAQFEKQGDSGNKDLQSQPSSSAPTYGVPFPRWKASPVVDSVSLCTCKNKSIKKVLHCKIKKKKKSDGLRLSLPCKVESVIPSFCKGL